MKTEKEIKEQIQKLKDVRPKVVPKTAFGDDNLARIDAQIRVLENNMDSNEVWDYWDDDDICVNAIEAADWRDDLSDIEDLSEDWPLKNNK